MLMQRNGGLGGKLCSAGTGGRQVEANGVGAQNRTGDSSFGDP